MLASSPSLTFSRVRGSAGSHTSYSNWPPCETHPLPVQSYLVTSLQVVGTLPKDCTVPSGVSDMLIGTSGHGVTPLHEPSASLAGGEQSAGSRPAE